MRLDVGGESQMESYRGQLLEDWAVGVMVGRLLGMGLAFVHMGLHCR